MVDLKTQHGRIRSELDKALLASAHAGRFINGPEVAVFAAELADYLQVEHVIPCANGTDALQIALMALGLKPGDEVITASFTYVATAEVIALLQLSLYWWMCTQTISPWMLIRWQQPSPHAARPSFLYTYTARVLTWNL